VKYLLGALITTLLVSAVVLIMIGPRMYVQPNIRTFQARVDPLPKGVVPYEEIPVTPAGDRLSAYVVPPSGGIPAKAGTTNIHSPVR